MANIKTQFSELRKNTPKHVQWLLLIAAFVVVVILLTLLLGGEKKQKVEGVETIPVELKIDPDSLDWSTTQVGEIKSQRFILSSNLPVKIADVRASEGMSAALTQKTTCKNIGQINDKISCTIDVEYSPKTPMETSAETLFVDWRGAAQPEGMNRTDKIVIVVGAVVKEEPKPEPEPEPIVEEKPQIQQEIEAIASINPFTVEEPEQIVTTPIPEPAAPRIPEKKTKAESCSDFAFPGYNAAGTQIGWIRPERGAYMFHPFSDKNCDSPTGIYNPDNGIITDINNPSRKIGTDAENIGYGNMYSGTLPQLSNPVEPKSVNRARQLDSDKLSGQIHGKSARVFFAPPSEKIMTSSGTTVTSTAPYDRTFILRQYKPIPATIVSEIRADQRLLSADHKLPVIATVDRNVYSDNGRTIIIPTGTTLYGYVTGDVPGPYKAIGRMEVRWYQFVRPDGVEFNFYGDEMDPFSADAQGRAGVPGRGSTDYMEQFVMPMLTAVVPAAVNMIAPISDKFVNQIDLNNNTVTQSGQVRSSELAKNEIVTAWNKVAQKLLVDMMDNTVPPFSISAGSRITVFSPVDLQVTCGKEGDKKCAISEYGNPTRANPGNKVTGMAKSAENIGSDVGQVRSFNLDGYCDGNGNVTATAETIRNAGYDYRTVVFYCQSAQYTAINNAKQAAVWQNQQDTGFASQGMVTSAGGGGQTIQGNKDYNEQVLGLKYKEDGTIQNPFETPPPAPAAPTLTCEDGTPPDGNGCCTGETYTDMGEQGFNCCPDTGGDCFPPIL